MIQSGEATTNKSDRVILLFFFAIEHNITSGFISQEDYEASRYLIYFQNFANHKFQLTLSYINFILFVFGNGIPISYIMNCFNVNMLKWEMERNFFHVLHMKAFTSVLQSYHCLLLLISNVFFLFSVRQYHLFVKARNLPTKFMDYPTNFRHLKLNPISTVTQWLFT